MYTHVCRPGSWPQSSGQKRPTKGRTGQAWDARITSYLKCFLLPAAGRALPQQTRHIYPMFDQCWTNVVDGGPTLVKHWVDMSCFLCTDQSLDNDVYARPTLSHNQAYVVCHCWKDSWPFSVILHRNLTFGERESERVHAFNHACFLLLDQGISWNHINFINTLMRIVFCNCSNRQSFDVKKLNVLITWNRNSLRELRFQVSTDCLFLPDWKTAVN